RRWSWQKRGPCPAVEKTLRGKVQKQTFPPSLEIPQKARDSHFPTAPTAADVFLQRPRPKTQTRRKSHYPWTKNGGQVKGSSDFYCFSEWSQDFIYADPESNITKPWRKHDR